MKKVVICANRNKPHMLEAVRELEPWLRQRAEVFEDREDRPDWEGGPVDFVAAFGGDGTVLRAARKFSAHKVPIVGINVGKLGFLTETTADQSREVLADALEGRYQVAERMMLHCRLERGGEVLVETLGLNDAVISRTSFSRLITIDFLVDGEMVTTYGADGLIVASPVGSTAHSLAASGPIMHPDMEGFVVCPICPHTLSNRPIVLPAQAKVEMRPRAFAENPALTVDGRIHHVLESGDRVLVRRAEHKLLLIRTGRQTFFETLRTKLDWSGQTRYAK